MTTYSTLEAAARAYGATHEVASGRGGWLYHHGAVICQGWTDYGYRLVSKNQIHVLDKAGCRIDREKTAQGVLVRSWRQWRPQAASFVIPEAEPADRRLAVPEAVAVDTRGGYVFRNAEDGLAFTIETAQAFADLRNEHLKVPTYRVYRLVPVEG